MKRQILILFISIGSTAFTIAAGQDYTLDRSDSKLTVEGTSTLHDWEMATEEMAGKGTFSFGDSQFDITSFSFQLQTESLKSESKAMDKNTYKALKSADYPQIKYVLKKVENSQGTGQDFVLNTTGILTIAGVSKTIDMPVEVKISDDHLKFSGKVDLKMTDFDVDPPVLMFGTLKTGNEITIEFNVQYSKSTL